MRRRTKVSGNLTAAQKELLKLEEELRRKELAVQERLRRLPKEHKARREEQRKVYQLDATTAVRGEYLSRLQHERGTERTPRRPKELRSKRKKGRTEFLILCAIFVIILFALMRVTN